MGKMEKYRRIIGLRERIDEAVKNVKGSASDSDPGIREGAKAELDSQCAILIANVLMDVTDAIEVSIKDASDKSEKLTNKIFWLYVVIAVCTFFGVAATLLVNHDKLKVLWCSIF